jgi:hypothetical protein
VAGVELVVEQPLVDAVADLDQCIPVVLGEAAADAEVVRVVDGRLGPERAAFLEVLLDLAGAVVDLDRGLDADVEDLGVKAARRATGHAAPEHDGDLVGAPERELVRERTLKPRAARRRAVKDARVGELQLPERELVAIPAPAILGAER